MIRGFYTASSGLQAYQQQLDIQANNLANVNTVGYKAVRASFTDLLHQNISRPAEDAQTKVGTGMKINKTDWNMETGALQNTGRTLDVAILEENGYFMVMTPQEEVRYTKTGNFSLSNNDDEWYLVDSNGYTVLNQDEEPLELTTDEEGNLEFELLEIGVARFPNPYGLEAVGGGCYITTEVSGEGELLEEPALRAGFLESSNVDLSQEMVGVIEASKAFAFSSRMVQVADEVEQTINNLR